MTCCMIYVQSSLHDQPGHEELFKRFLLQTRLMSCAWSCPQFFLDCIANTTATLGSILLKTSWLGISFLYFVDAYRERKKLLQYELQALEKGAEARCVVLVSCNCSILILLLYSSVRIYKQWVFLHPFILFIWTCFNYHRNSRIKTAPDQTPTSRKGWNYVSIFYTNVHFLSMLNLLVLLA